MPLMPCPSEEAAGLAASGHVILSLSNTVTGASPRGGSCRDADCVLADPEAQRISLQDLQQVLPSCVIVA